MQFSRSLSALTVLLLATSAALLAQTMGSSSGQVAHIGSPRANNVPYTLTRTSTLVQTLANGTTITRTFTVKTARDSEGGTYSETQQTLHVRADGQPVDWVHYFVSDPVARTNINWDSHTQIATVTHMPDPKVPDVDTARQPQAGRPTQQVTREDLGVRTIAGIEAKGTRTTGTIPAGDQGNDRPLTIVTDNWMSTQYDIPLLTITNDPRTGKRTDEVTEFQPGEPDPVLFQIPKGYTVRERTAF
jgi:VCBS repeat-containing protein